MNAFVRAITFASLLAAAVGATPVVVSAADSPVVVELFTSQGCSSCPPADELLQELAERRDVIALALHVDYWDYIGWKDIFGSAAFTARQQGYAQAAGATRIYTPQFVVGGTGHVVGARAMQLMDMIRTVESAPQLITLAAARQGDKITVSAQALRALPGPVDVQVVTFLPEQTVDIRRGENAGRRLSYANIVTSWSVVSHWSGRRDLAVSVTPAQPGPVVVILQQSGFGPILAAARVD